MPDRHRSRASAPDSVLLLAGMFRRARWKVRRRPSAGDSHPHLVVEGGGKCFVFEIIRSPEGRRDRLIPLLSQAILQARWSARQFQGGAVPVAVVAANRIPFSTAEHVKQFAALYAPETGVGIVDSQGLRSFSGYGLEVFNARPSPPQRRTAVPRRLPDLFSDLNQWMLKILLGQSIPESLLTAPRELFRNASQLAFAAQVSVMSASRFVRQLRNEGFLDERGEGMSLARSDDLLERWAAANQPGAGDIPVRWIIPRDIPALHAALRSYGVNARHRPRCALGLFAAAEALGFGFVQGVPPHIYVERFDPEALHALGFSMEGAEHRADAYVRVATNPEAVFRAAVERDGLLVSDIIQVWLDVSRHPARGKEQANQIWRRVIAPAIGKR